MIDFLMRLHACKQFRFDMTISPTQIKVKIKDRLSLQQVFIFFSHMLNNSILRFYISQEVHATLTTILCFLFVSWLL